MACKGASCVGVGVEVAVNDTYISVADFCTTTASSPAPSIAESVDRAKLFTPMRRAILVQVPALQDIISLRPPSGTVWVAASHYLPEGLWTYRPRQVVCQGSGETNTHVRPGPEWTITGS